MDTTLNCVLIHWDTTLRRTMKKLLLIGFAFTMLLGCAQQPLEPAQPVDLEAIVEAIKAEYGEDFAPSMPYDETWIVERLGIQAEWMDAFIGLGPMMMISSDELIIIRASEGNIENVLTAFREYQRFLREESFQYPMNMPRVANARLESVGNYVIFIIAGAFFEYPTDGSDWDEQAEIDFIIAQFQRGVDVFRSFFD